ncbi:methyl-accepting chemotaxis protein [Desulfovibrio inopinatus]|uniref:methyl-accepting chemotaxis protein n=1 Tax=Desulfovibrio inopinatus TaxID=102109 RepID=UPI0003F960C4|nr:methyl-accepting chemotaxis protein [Desulfovibrio inopinatus]
MFKIRSIKQKFAFMSGVCLIVSAFCLIIYGLISTSNTNRLVLNNVSKILKENAFQNLESLASSQAGVVQSALQDNLDSARVIAKVFETLKLKTSVDANELRDIFNEILLGVLENNPTYLGAYSAWEPNALDNRDAEFAGDSAGGYDATGRFIPYWNRDKSGKIARQPLVGYEDQDTYANGVRKGGWYLAPKESGKESVLDPFPYIVQGKQDWLTTLSVPIKKNGQFLGIAGTDLRLDFLQELATEVNNNLYEGKGDVVILSYEGLVVANSDNPQSIGKSVSTLFSNFHEVIDKVQRGVQWVGISDTSGNIVAYAPIQLGRTDKPWCMLLRVPADIVLAKANTLQSTLNERADESISWQIGVGSAITLIGIIFIWFFTGTISRPIQKSAAYARNVANGDFNQHLDVNQADEIGVLSDALRTMVENLKGKIAEAEAKGEEARRETAKAKEAMTEAEKAKARAEQAKAEGMLHAATQLEDVVEIITSASEELSSQIEQASHGAEEQAHRASETATSMEEMNATVFEVAQNSSHAANTADQAAQKAEEGAKVVRLAVGRIADVQRQSLEMKSDMGLLGQQAEDIGHIMNVISDIADQTNLLALNAAIEAARAGEAGRGFAVVADEVRKLAEKTMSATKDVGDAIQKIQDGTKKNIENVERSGKTTEEATDLANQSGDALLEIVSLVESTSDQVRSIATASEEQSSASEEIHRNVEDVNRISSETSHAMQQSAQAVSELANQAQVLKTLIQEMTAESNATQAIASGPRMLS